jgi:hypothetical protein
MAARANFQTISPKLPAPDAGEKQVIEMRSPRRFVAVSVIITTTIVSTSHALAAGRSPTAAVNTILNGRGAPKPSLGIDGDFYIDTRSLLFYGPKTKGKWLTPRSIQGPTGPSGNDGKNGSDGKASTSNVSAVTGAQGPVGPAGPQGEKGEKGEAGAPGATGAAGPAGVSGSSGPAGPSGANGAQGPTGPTGAQGPTGPTGPTGAQGPVGATGAQGPKGETGTAGTSEITVVEIPQTILGTSVAYTFITSPTFGVLKANCSYEFNLFIRGGSNTVGLVLGLDVIAAGGTIQFNYIRADSRLATLSSAPSSYGFMATGTIEVGGSDSTLAVKIIDAYGDTGASPVTFSGKAYITLVGAIK